MSVLHVDHWGSPLQSVTCVVLVGHGGPASYSARAPASVPTLIMESPRLFEASSGWSSAVTHPTATNASATSHVFMPQG